ncbi:MAG: sensor domain-containing diguanylate cyclase [Christensenellales bacterium]
MNTIFDDRIYRFLFDNSVDAMVIEDPAGKIKRANPAACKLFQRTEEELCQISKDDLLDINDSSTQDLLTKIAQNIHTRNELMMLRKDGSRFTGDCASSVFDDGKGNLWIACIIRDITQYKQEEESLRKSKEEAVMRATYDHLTGLLNHWAFMERFQQELERIKREKTQCGLIIFDIDHFKEINDQYGHVTGDYVLRAVVKKLSQHLRVYDLIGRFGGDEFIICLPNSSLDESTIVAERLRQYANELEIAINSSRIRLTASFGVASYQHTSKKDIDTFISMVDDAMYQAKLKRNHVVSINA